MLLLAAGFIQNCIIVQMYSNQVYLMLQLLNYSKTIQKHIDIKDINVSMINHSYIKYKCLFTQIHYTH